MSGGTSDIHSAEHSGFDLRLVQSNVDCGLQLQLEFGNYLTFNRADDSLNLASHQKKECLCQSKFSLDDS